MKQPRLHIFVPENDLALASGVANYTPPPIGMKMHLAGEALPMAYASPGDRFISYGFSEAELGRLTDLLGPEVDLATREEIRSGVYAPSPWGWSRYTRSLLAEMGVPESTLPSNESLDQMRQLSHRRTSIAVNKELGHEGATELFSPEEVATLLSAGGACYLKQPWSGSGRGVMSTAGMSAESVMKFAGASIRRQGSVLAEKALDSTGDFATLWYCENGVALFHGYSRFITHGDGGKYAGNLVAQQDNILQAILSLGLTRHILEETVGCLEKALTHHIASRYSGPVGVDMLAYNDHDGCVKIAPCIEINLRYTMGFVAEGLAKKLSPEEPMLLTSVPWEETRTLPTDSIILSQPGTLVYILKHVY